MTPPHGFWLRTTKVCSARIEPHIRCHRRACQRKSDLPDLRHLLTAQLGQARVAVRYRVGWHRASLSEIRGNESAFTRVFNALSPQVTAENGRALSQFERNTL